MFDRLNLRIGGALLLIGGVIWFWAALQPAPQYYKFVDEVVAARQRFRKRRTHLLVHGCVARGSVLKATDRPLYRFRIESVPERPAAAIEARYTGVLPDLFRPGIRVVAEGALGEDGRLEVVPDGIMVTCPGKYDGPGPHVAECPPSRG